eukprot:653302-Rhodomonas_salina.1
MGCCHRSCHSIGLADSSHGFDGSGNQIAAAGCVEDVGEIADDALGLRSNAPSDRLCAASNASSNNSVGYRTHRRRTEHSPRVLRLALSSSR